MITIRCSKNSSEVALTCLEATLTMPRGVYSISSNGPMMDSGSPLGGGLFGAISWPLSCFRLAEGLLLEQQMFLPHDGCRPQKLEAAPMAPDPEPCDCIEKA